jgi:acetoin utilization deacetylase AcuC-like enzyme
VAFLLYDPVFRAHDVDPKHPECPGRLDAILAALAPRHLEKPAREATRSELERVHTPAYLDRLLAQRGRWGEAGPEAELCPASVEAALVAAGAAIELVDRLLLGQRGMVLCRPPGHHARPHEGMGFCVLNNIAVAAAHARARGVERVLILDWDVHHGNGTQEIFYGDPSVFFCSIHQSPLYPDSGFEGERGEGAGLGYTRNLPMPAGADDREWLGALEKNLVPEVDQFRPQMILVSAGFDAHQLDPLAGSWLTAAGYRAMTRLVIGLAHRHASGRVGLLLEGGYRLDTLGGCVAACVEELERG